MYRTRILLVRHGHYERAGNLGDTVWGLTPLGRKQAARTGKRLRELLAADRDDLAGVYASPWPRALQTAQIATREMKIKADAIQIRDHLHEVMPLVDPKRSAEYGIHPGLPVSSEEDRARTMAQVSRVREEFFGSPAAVTTVVLFTHGNLIRYLVTGTFKLPPEAWNRLDIAHAGITEIQVFPDSFEALIGFNDTGHLPTSMITSA
ncbi:MAG: histidine phosphatase family protein [Myxococcales bacterium]|nr:histidine phosphatase family protein [Myxococcales bacterium]